MKQIASSFTLPNGSILTNRIAKSAMSENFGTANHAPSSGLINAYRVWAKGNPGLLITGNVMVDSKALGEARNVVVEDYKHFDLLKKWAQSVVAKHKIVLYPKADTKLSSLFFSDSVAVAIGPEGDFTKREISLLKEKDFIPVKMGERILRADTAAISVISSIRTMTKEF